jgi:hypothetical protein
MHHLTAGELALGGSAITAVASAVVAMVVAHASKRSDHVAKLWEHRAAVYESVLCRAYWWEELREDMAWAGWRDEVTTVDAPSVMSDDDREERQVRARIRMYAERKVREAYERSYKADREFLGTYIRWHTIAEVNTKAAHGTVPAHQAVDGAELVRLRKEMEAANDAAREERERLEEIVAGAIARLPRYQRWTWRRLKPPPPANP